MQLGMSGDAGRKILRIGLLNPVANLDPRAPQDLLSTLLLAQIYETPYAAPSGGGDPAAVLFSEPLRRESADRLSLSAAVRPGLLFSDGTPVTAERLAEALRQVSLLAEQAEIEANGERVHFRLSRPNARFDLLLTHHACMVALDAGSERLGTGPYRKAPDSVPERVRLVRNPNYRGRPAIEELIFTVYPPDPDGTPTALLTAVQQGEVDFTSSLSREHIGGLKGVRKWMEPGCGAAFLYFNTERPLLADRDVRRALCLAIDREEATRLCYSNPLSFAATSILPPMFGRARDFLDYNVREAGRLLAQSGDAAPKRLKLLTVWGPRPYLPSPPRVAAYLASCIESLGIQVDVATPASRPDYFESIARGDYDLVLAGWIADTVDPADFLEQLLASERVPTDPSRIGFDANFSRWRHPATDAALDRFRAEPTDQHREDVLALVRTQAPLQPLTYGATVFAYSHRLKQFTPSLLGIPHFGDIELAA
jgi:ABC-type transport system substrate-binding protein